MAGLSLGVDGFARGQGRAHGINRGALALARRVTCEGAEGVFQGSVDG